MAEYEEVVILGVPVMECYLRDFESDWVSATKGSQAKVWILRHKNHHNHRVLVISETNACLLNSLVDESWVLHSQAPRELVWCCFHLSPGGSGLEELGVGLVLGSSKDKDRVRAGLESSMHAMRQAIPWKIEKAPVRAAKPVVH